MGNERSFDFQTAVLDLATEVDLLIKSLGGLPMPPEIQSLREGFRNHYDNFCQYVDAGDGAGSGDVATSVLQAGSMALKLAQAVLMDERISPAAEQRAHTTIEKANVVAFQAQTTSIFFKPLTPLGVSESDTPSHVVHDARRKELERQYDVLRSEISSSELKLKELQLQGDELATRISEQLSQTSQLYADGEKEIKSAQSDFNDLIGVSTGDVLDGDYSKSAKREKVAAEWTRAGALAFMVAVALGLIYMLVHEDLDKMAWQLVVARVLLALALSIPAGYLARESVRHRSQQHAYLQTSLNLKAITPFIASLPVDQRHTLKTAMAERLFGNHPPAHGHADLGLINAHELALQLIKQLEVKLKN